MGLEQTGEASVSFQEHLFSEATPPSGVAMYDDAQSFSTLQMGDSDGENASGYVTREQLAAMLWRYAVYKGYDVSIGEDTNILSYEDVDQAAEYAIPALQWACGAGILEAENKLEHRPLAPAGRWRNSWPSSARR